MSQLNNDTNFQTATQVSQSIAAAVVGFLTEESDPTVFDYIKDITETDIANWNNKADLDDIPDDYVSTGSIKTINSQSIIGTGNIQLVSSVNGSTGDVQVDLSPYATTASVIDSMSLRESTENKVTAISSTSTDVQYPSAKAVQSKIDSLSGTANIASVSDGVVTIKRGVLEQSGSIGNTTDSDITLHKVATSGNPSDIVVSYDQTTTNLQAALNTIKGEIDAAASAGTTYIVCNNVASEIPAGFTYYRGVTGTLAASNTTAGKVYLVKNGEASYDQVITTYSGGVYSWTSLGSTVVDLSGVVRTVTVNGKQIGAGSGTMVDIGEPITSVTGQSAITNPNTSLISVVATTGQADSSTGTKGVTLEAQAKVASVADGSTGLAEASDVKSYVDDRIIFRTWTNE